MFDNFGHNSLNKVIFEKIYFKGNGEFDNHIPHQLYNSQNGALLSVYLHMCQTMCGRVKSRSIFTEEVLRLIRPDFLALFTIE